jgi:hypothetical protein
MAKQIIYRVLVFTFFFLGKISFCGAQEIKDSVTTQSSFQGGIGLLAGISDIGWLGGIQAEIGITRNILRMSYLGSRGDISLVPFASKHDPLPTEYYTNTALQYGRKIISWQTVKDTKVYEGYVGIFAGAGYANGIIRGKFLYNDTIPASFGGIIYSSERITAYYEEKNIRGLSIPLDIELSFAKGIINYALDLGAVITKEHVFYNFYVSVRLGSY